MCALFGYRPYPGRTIGDLTDRQLAMLIAFAQHRRDDEIRARALG